MKNPSLSTLKKKFWKIFSQYSRRKNADGNGYVRCISCQRISHWKQMDAGHYHPKALGLSVYFVEKNVHAQCTYCNHVLEGNQVEYSKRLIEMYGPGILEELDALKYIQVKYSKSDYLEMIETYQKKLKDLNGGEILGGR